MAKLIPNNPLAEVITQGIPSEGLQEGIFYAGKAMRFKIIADRYNRGFQKEEVNGPRGAFETSGLSIFETGKLEREKAIRESRRNREQINDYTPENYTSEPFVRNPTTKINDYISIVDLDFKDEHLATRYYSKLVLPFVPRELSYEPASKFVGIATIGRNTPFYQFTGSEDTIKFEIDWFAKNADRQDVINSCRWVEALTKSNGYDEPPHRVKLIWGQNDLLWQDDIWLLTEAPYVLSEFVKAYKDGDNIVRLGLMPQQAIQTVTLKRIASTNRMSSDIIGPLANSNSYGQ